MLFWLAGVLVKPLFASVKFDAITPLHWYNRAVHVRSVETELQGRIENSTHISQDCRELQHQHVTPRVLVVGMSAEGESGQPKGRMFLNVLNGIQKSEDCDTHAPAQPVQESEGSRPQEQTTAALSATNSTAAPFSLPSNTNWNARPQLAAGASGAAALLTCCALHPFDLIKTRMQGTAGTSRRRMQQNYRVVSVLHPGHISSVHAEY